MKPTPLFVEALEARVAPAVLVNGGNLLGGKGNPTTGETSNGENSVTLIKVLSGQALVFYDAAGEHITGISIGKNTRLDITGDISGDIVTNLLPNGRLTDSDGDATNGENGGILLPYTIKGITTHPLGGEHGDIGKIIAGGAITNVNVNGSLSGLYSGNGIFRHGDQAVVSVGTVDYNTIQPGLQDTFTLDKSDAKSSSKANISNVVVTTANNLEIFAGSGYNNTTTKGGIGGSIVNVTITETLSGQGSKPALYLHAGDGGAGTDGGQGGAITNFDDKGSIAYVELQTGNGGTASGGTGGAGGSLQASTIMTSSPRYDLLMGHGGDGATGGKGGSISTLNFTNHVTGGNSLIATGDYNNDGIQDVLLINTLTSEGTLSLGKAGGGTTTVNASALTQAASTANLAYTVALQPTTNPDGTAGTTPFIAAEGAVPTGVEAADFNGDGNLDFVVSYAATNNLGRFLGHGDGTFTANSIALPVSPSKIAIGDFAGTPAIDVAVLASGSLPAVNGSMNSQVYLLGNDGTGTLTVLPNPTLVHGLGTALAAAQVDGVGGTDLFVGLQSGAVDPLLNSGASFVEGTPINVFNVVGTGSPVTSLDVLAGGTGGGVTLLAFSKNINANDPSVTDVTPQVNLVAVQADGTANGTTVFTPSGGAVTAHFVTGTAVVGVVSPGALTLYSNVNGTYAQTSSLGSNGVLSDFSGSIDTDGTYHIIATGAATNRFFFTSGDPFSDTGLPIFGHFNVPYEPRVISFVAGGGGAGDAHNGGVGGSVKSLNYTQTLGEGVREAGGSYNTFVTTGTGGSSNGGNGGNGGDIASVSLSLNPGYRNDFQDDTTLAVLRTGAGGSGTSGGNGGGVTKTTSNSVFSNTHDNTVEIDYVAVSFFTGNGGAGTAKTGGNGGSITLEGTSSLSGVTSYDPDSLTPDAAGLLVQAGDGGNGVTAGGAGGTVANVGTQNAVVGSAVVATTELSTAQLISGKGGTASGGTGGAGGNLTGLNVSVENAGLGGWLAINAGAGGNSTNGTGGAGGSVAKSTAASVSGDPFLGFGVLVTGGVGGDGTTGGGLGGGVKKLTVNTPSESDLYAAVIAAGNGGAATGSGAGGAGGSIKGIAQSKDVNSAITAILGGSGGTSKGGAGGVGGSVKKIDTVGFIGLPASDTEYLGVYDGELASPTLAPLFADGQVTQGIYAGRGADGAANGAVSNVVARQIAAIGAVVDENGLFGVAAAVNKVNADVIGYDAAPVGTVQNHTFDSTIGATSPSKAVPIDGFLLASSVSGITTQDPNRTAAFTFNG